MYGWAVRIILPAFYALIFLIGLTGNVAILVLIATRKKMHSVTNIFIGLLAFGDLLTVVFCMPFSVPSIYITEVLCMTFALAFCGNFQKWTLGMPVCRFVIMIQNASVFLSALTLTAMSMERYFVIVHPIKALVIWTKRIAIYVSVGLTAFSLLSSLPVALLSSMASVPDQPKSNQSDTEDIYCLATGPSPFITYFYSYRLCLTYFLPLVSMAILYGLTIKRLLAVKSKHSPSASVIETRRKVINMLVAMVVIFAVCWLPKTIFLLLVMVKPEVILTQKMLMVYFPFSGGLIYFNCIMNPFLYSFMSAQYRKGFKEMFRRLFLRRDYSFSEES